LSVSVGVATEEKGAGWKPALRNRGDRLTRFTGAPCRELIELKEAGDERKD